MAKSLAVGNIVGAFADSAVLLPLLLALSQKVGFESSLLFLSAGSLYIFSGFFFRVPMAVQPLKSLATTALVIGASVTEVRIAAFLVGLSCLLILSLKGKRFLDRVPTAIIHGLQLGLGILLVFQASALSAHSIVPVLITTSLMVLGLMTSFPVLGLFATAVLIYSMWSGVQQATDVSVSQFASNEWMRTSVILNLFVPQLVLTLANSVVATQDVAKRYFGENAKKVTTNRLLTSIGFGNMAMALVGGFPFCHGSGGVTAHYQGGARIWHSNLIIGISLIALGVFQFHQNFSIILSPNLFAALLMTNGVYHVFLIAPSFKNKDAPTFDKIRNRFSIIAMGVTAAITTNLMAVLLVGVAVMSIISFLFNNKMLIAAKPGESL